MVFCRLPTIIEKKLGSYGLPIRSPNNINAFKFTTTDYLLNYSNFSGNCGRHDNPYWKNIGKILGSHRQSTCVHLMFPAFSKFLVVANKIHSIASLH
jgi:hypothetical protein